MLIVHTGAGENDENPIHSQQVLPVAHTTVTEQTCVWGKGEGESWPWGPLRLLWTTKKGARIFLLLWGKKWFYLPRRRKIAHSLLFGDQRLPGPHRVEATGSPPPVWAGKQREWNRIWIMTVAQKRSLDHGPHVASARTTAGLGQSTSYEGRLYLFLPPPPDSVPTPLPGSR